MSGFPWAEAMGFGFGTLRLAPKAFWAMTPRELMAAFRAHGGGRGAAPARGALDALMARYPDGDRA